MFPIFLIGLIAYFFLLAYLFVNKRYAITTIAILSPFVIFMAYQRYWYTQFIPSQIEISYPITVGEEGAFREGCGIAVYQISSDTLRTINKDGLRFFAGANRGRRSSEYRSKPISYEIWKETPVPASWTTEGTWIMCNVGDAHVVREITEAAKHRGAYYTTARSGMQLLVFPSLGYVAYSFND